MINAADSTDETSSVAPTLPGWARCRTAPAIAEEPLETAAFAAGGTLSSLHNFACGDEQFFPAQLWRRRLALAAAQRMAAIHGRTEDEGDLRDVFYLTKPGDDPGPAGRTLVEWRQLGSAKMMRPTAWIDFAVERNSGRDEKLEEVILEATDHALKQSNAVSAAAHAAAHILDHDPRDAPLALFIADAVLTKKLKWPAPVPLLAIPTNRSHLRNAVGLLKGNEEWLKICYRNYARAAATAFDLACDLQRRAAELKNCAPKLRARGAARAVDIFLTEDAVQPSGNFADRTGMSERAARRVCDRLVSLGGIREFTGRPTHRLYGL